MNIIAFFQSIAIIRLKLFFFNQGYAHNSLHRYKRTSTLVRPIHPPPPPPSRTISQPHSSIMGRTGDLIVPNRNSLTHFPSINPQTSSGLSTTNSLAHFPIFDQQTTLARNNPLTNPVLNENIERSAVLHHEKAFSLEAAAARLDLDRRFDSMEYERLRNRHTTIFGGDGDGGSGNVPNNNGGGDRDPNSSNKKYSKILAALEGVNYGTNILTSGANTIINAVNSNIQAEHMQSQRNISERNLEQNKALTNAQIEQMNLQKNRSEAITNAELQTQSVLRDTYKSKQNASNIEVQSSQYLLDLRKAQDKTKLMSDIVHLQNNIKSSEERILFLNTNIISVPSVPISLYVSALDQIKTEENEIRLNNVKINQLNETINMLYTQ